MNLLIDTHVLLAVIGGNDAPETERLRGAIGKGARAVVSVASLWEMAIKWRLGKLPLPAGPERLPDLVRAIGFELLPIGAGHVVVAVEPDPPTRDPFDRLLLAQCQVEGLKLLTADRALTAHPLAVSAI